MTGKYRRTLAPATAVAMALGLAGCQSLGGMGIGQSSGPSKSEMIQDEVDRNIRLAKAAQSAGQHEVALGIYSKLLRLDPAASEFRTATGEIYFEQGAHAQSLAAFDTALSGEMPSEAAHAAAYIGRGRARLATGDATGAERDFKAAVALNAASAVAINGRGVAADMQGQHALAQAYYRDALAVDPGNERVRSNLGLSLALAARFDDAVAQLAPLATTSESAQKARYNLALTFGLMGRPTEARELVATAIAPRAADGNGLFYAATRDAVRAEAARHSAIRPDVGQGNDLTPRRQSYRDVVNEPLLQTPAAPVDAKPAAKVADVEEPPVAEVVEPEEPQVVQTPVVQAPETEEMSVAEPAPLSNTAADVASVEPTTEAPTETSSEPSTGASFVETFVQILKDSKSEPEPAFEARPENPAVDAQSAPEDVLADPVVDAPAVDAAAAVEGQPGAEATSAPSSEPASAGLEDVSAFRSPKPVVTKHLDENDAFYAAMRGVVDGLAKPSTPWGKPMRLGGPSDQLASK